MSLFSLSGDAIGKKIYIAGFSLLRRPKPIAGQTKKNEVLRE